MPTTPHTTAAMMAVLLLSSKTAPTSVKPRVVHDVVSEGNGKSDGIDESPSETGMVNEGSFEPVKEGRRGDDGGKLDANGPAFDDVCGGRTAGVVSVVLGCDVGGLQSIGW
jgi:hypothetical protein